METIWVRIEYFLEMGEGVDDGRSFSCFFASCGKKVGDKEIRVEGLIYILIRNLSRKFPRERKGGPPILPFVSFSRSRQIRVVLLPEFLPPFLILTSLRRISL